MQTKKKKNRPLSPHITIYRPQFTSVTSILTRITGNSLLVGSLIFVFWFISVAMGENYFNKVSPYINSGFVDFIMFLSIWAFWYHFLAGLRHLYWDTGRGLELYEAKILAYIVVVGSFCLSAFTALII
ncbi:MAG: succinate dehydrogenase, cytochrome b556 subunit [Proteobacteria bacterium]|jgi:succinate dehydrogenase / fumarate reductase cytochrome b subunit|nr:succinate dehydrogenase, cytochrome b556 subunit [Pseudomonadota bacterium]MDA1237380.1 succinate dehydrogenase, cytochrome b556 subunit [Pseudomonadota bacterium]